MSFFLKPFLKLKKRGKKKSKYIETYHDEVKTEYDGSKSPTMFAGSEVSERSTTNLLSVDIEVLEEENVNTGTPDQVSLPKDELEVDVGVGIQNLHNSIAPDVPENSDACKDLEEKYPLSNFTKTPWDTDEKKNVVKVSELKIAEENLPENVPIDPDVQVIRDKIDELIENVTVYSDVFSAIEKLKVLENEYNKLYALKMSSQKSKCFIGDSNESDVNKKTQTYSLDNDSKATTLDTEKVVDDSDIETFEEGLNMKTVDFNNSCHCISPKSVVNETVKNDKKNTADVPEHPDFLKMIKETENVTQKEKICLNSIPIEQELPPSVGNIYQQKKRTCRAELSLGDHSRDGHYNLDYFQDSDEFRTIQANENGSCSISENEIQSPAGDSSNGNFQNKSCFMKRIEKYYENLTKYSDEELTMSGENVPNRDSFSGTTNLVKEGNETENILFGPHEILEEEDVLPETMFVDNSEDGIKVNTSNVEEVDEEHYFRKTSEENINEEISSGKVGIENTEEGVNSQYSESLEVISDLQKPNTRKDLNSIYSEKFIAENGGTDYQCQNLLVENTHIAESFEDTAIAFMRENYTGFTFDEKSCASPEGDLESSGLNFPKPKIRLRNAAAYNCFFSDSSTSSRMKDNLTQGADEVTNELYLEYHSRDTEGAGTYIDDEIDTTDWETPNNSLKGNVNKNDYELNTLISFEKCFEREEEEEKDETADQLLKGSRNAISTVKHLTAMDPINESRNDNKDVCLGDGHELSSEKTNSEEKFQVNGLNVELSKCVCSMQKRDEMYCSTLISKKMNNSSNFALNLECENITTDKEDNEDNTEVTDSDTNQGKIFSESHLVNTRMKTATCFGKKQLKTRRSKFSLASSTDEDQAKSSFLKKYESYLEKQNEVACTKHPQESITPYVCDLFIPPVDAECIKESCFEGQLNKNHPFSTYTNTSDDIYLHKETYCSKEQKENLEKTKPNIITKGHTENKMLDESKTLLKETVTFPKVLPEAAGREKLVIEIRSNKNPEKVKGKIPAKIAEVNKKHNVHLIKNSAANSEFQTKLDESLERNFSMSHEREKMSNKLNSGAKTLQEKEIEMKIKESNETFERLKKEATTGMLPTARVIPIQMAESFHTKFRKGEDRNVRNKLTSLRVECTPRHITPNINSRVISDQCNTGVERSAFPERLQSVTPLRMKLLEKSRAIRSPKYAVDFPKVNNQLSKQQKITEDSIFCSRGVPFLFKDETTGEYHVKRGYPAKKIGENGNPNLLDETRRRKYRSLTPDDMTKMFDSKFKNYAGRGRPNGELICYKRSTDWLRDAGVVGEELTEEEANDVFKNTAGLKVALNKRDYRNFLMKLSKIKRLNYTCLFGRLCDAQNKDML